MTVLLCSPAEPDFLKTNATVSPLCENYGCDFLWHSDLGHWCGLQRKELHDLVSSIQNSDRLIREVFQMQELAVRILIIEGLPKWGPNGELMDRYTKWSRKSHHSLIQSLSMSGITVHQTADLSDTAFTIQGLVEWTNKAEHNSLATRPKKITKVWGNPTEEDYAAFVLQSIPEVGATLARRILKHFGRLPLSWTITEQELLAVKGIGKPTAARIYRALPVFVAPEPPSASSPTSSPDSSSLSASSMSPPTPTSKGSRKRAATTKVNCSQGSTDEP